MIITGASSGIGASTARALAGRGYPLLLIARRTELMAGLGLPQAMCIGADVTDAEAMKRAVDSGVAAFGAPDLLVNNAGIMPLGRVTDQDPSEWQRLFDINCVAVLRASQLVVPLMIAQGHGTIVNIGSVAGRNLYPDHMAYCGTKFAVHAMSEQMRKELAHQNVRVAVVAPGMIETELLEGTTSGDIKTAYREYKSSIGGAIDPAFVAEAIVRIYELPQQVCVRELVMAPTRQDA